MNLCKRVTFQNLLGHRLFLKIDIPHNLFLHFPTRFHNKSLVTVFDSAMRIFFGLTNHFFQDKSFLHKNHIGNQLNKFHLKISLKSEELRKMKKIDSNKKIYKVLDKEMKNFIHSLQILID